MIIVPKISEDDLYVTENVLKHINDRIEIQMLTKDIILSLNKCMEVICNLLNKEVLLRTVVLHLPLEVCEFAIYLTNTNHLNKLNILIRSLIDYSMSYNIQFGIVLHNTLPISLLKELYCSGWENNNNPFKIDNGQHVFFLIENVLPYVKGGKAHIVHAFELLRELKYDSVYSLIDVCHLRCTENITGTIVELPKDIINCVKWIHFAGTLNKDGFVNSSTHGRVHPNIEDLREDLYLLVNNGVDITKIPLVTEISEDDYINRPDMLREIKMLNSI